MLNLTLKTQCLASEGINKKIFELSKAHLGIINNTAKDMDKHLKEILSVKVEGSGKLIIRSRAGEPPRMETGFLRSNTKVTTQHSGNTVKLLASVNNARYAKYLEYGTSTLAPRPFLLPTLNKFKEILKERIKNIQRFL